MLSTLMFVGAMVAGCPNVADNSSVSVRIESVGQSEAIMIEAYVSPRSYEAMVAQLDGSYSVTLVNGCDGYDPDFGEDGESNEAFDTFTGWEVYASDRDKLLMMELGFAHTRTPFIIERIEHGQNAGCQWERDANGNVNLFCPVKVGQ